MTQTVKEKNRIKKTSVNSFLYLSNYANNGRLAGLITKTDSRFGRKVVFRVN